MEQFSDTALPGRQEQALPPISYEVIEQIDLEMGRRQAEPFLLTVTAESTPHCGPVEVTWDTPKQRLVATPSPSRWSASAAAGHARVSILWPPDSPGGYSLIVDGTAQAAPATPVPALLLDISRAVLHRRGPEAADHRPEVSTSGSCRSDCIRLL